MGWCFFDLGRVDRHVLAQRAQGVDLGPAEDFVAGLVLGAEGVVLPALPWVDHHSLSFPFLVCGGAEFDDGAAAVGEEGDAKADGGVEGLAEEEVAVVEGGGGELDENLVLFRGGFGDFVEGEWIVDLSGLAGDLGDGY